ncbi:ATP-binding protein [Neisseria meningitidis]|uniref:ATP-binding protein n=1 Tax=Neisseria meningitidis TaxID=487 RepID=UPI00398018C3
MQNHRRQRLPYRQNARRYFLAQQAQQNRTRSHRPDTVLGRIQTRVPARPSRCRRLHPPRYAGQSPDCLFRSRPPAANYVEPRQQRVAAQPQTARLDFRHHPPRAKKHRLHPLCRPPEVQEHLFEPFYTTAENGTGLGLYVARELAHANFGDLTYLPEAKCFELALPEKTND